MPMNRNKMDRAMGAPAAGATGRGRGAAMAAPQGVAGQARGAAKAAAAPGLQTARTKVAGTPAAGRVKRGPMSY